MNEWKKETSTDGKTKCFVITNASEGNNKSERGMNCFCGYCSRKWWPVKSTATATNGHFMRHAWLWRLGGRSFSAGICRSYLTVILVENKIGRTLKTGVHIPLMVWGWCEKLINFNPTTATIATIRILAKESLSLSLSISFVHPLLWMLVDNERWTMHKPDWLLYSE